MHIQLAWGYKSMNLGSLPVSFSHQAIPFRSLQFRHILPNNKCNNKNVFWEAGCCSTALDQKWDSFYLILANYKLAA